MFSKISKLNDYDKVTLIYEPTVQAKEQKSKVLTYLFVLFSIAIFLLGVNFAFHFMRLTHPNDPTPRPLPIALSDLRNEKNDLSNIIGLNYDCPKTYMDYLLLSLSWPPTFCQYKTCKKRSRMSHWRIHGLWPNYNNGSYPQFCCPNYKFDFNELKVLSDDMNKYWNDLTSDDPEHSFWAHEWNKHGTCALINPKLASIIGYFNSTLTAYKQNDIEQWLEEADILPTASKSYKLTAIQKAIQSRLGNKRVKFECDKHTHKIENCEKADYSTGHAENCTLTKSHTYMLIDSIDICLDKVNLQPIDCPQIEEPKYRKHICGEDVYYLRTKDELDSLKF